MKTDGVLTFALRLDHDVVCVDTDTTGLSDLIARLAALSKSGRSSCSLHWRTPSVGGNELTEEKQREDVELIHDVKVLLGPHDPAPGDDYTWTFEITPDKRCLQIYCDPGGLQQMIHMLAVLPGKKGGPDHDHWMTRSWSGHELTEQRKGDGTILVNMVDVHYWP